MKKLLRNGTVVLPDAVLEGQTVVIDGSRIADIYPDRAEEAGMGEDLQGKTVMPGMIDIHSDMIENYIQPRSTAMMGFELGLKEAERVLASCGITTMFHSISMYRDGSWDVKAIR